MPTDTTIIDRLREIGDRLANAAWAQTCHDAADALTAAHAARDAAEQMIEQILTMARASIDAGERIIGTLRLERDSALRERDEARAALAEMTERERQAHAKRRP